MVSEKRSQITINMDDPISVVDAAKALGKHIATIYRWHEAGQLVAINVGGVLFIPRSEIERLKRDGK